jgi:hypothetical protein
MPQDLTWRNLRINSEETVSQPADFISEIVSFDATHEIFRLEYLALLVLKKISK